MDHGSEKQFGSSQTYEMRICNHISNILSQLVWHELLHYRNQDLKHEGNYMFIPSSLHINHLSTPFTKKFHHRPHVLFWDFHNSNLQKHHRKQFLSRDNKNSEFSKISKCITFIQSFQVVTGNEAQIEGEVYRQKQQNPNTH